MNKTIKSILATTTPNELRAIDARIHSEFKAAPKNLARMHSAIADQSVKLGMTAAKTPKRKTSKNAVIRDMIALKEGCA